MTYPAELVASVLSHYKRTRRSPFKTAKALDINIQDVWNIIDQNKDSLESPAERYGGWGREEMAPYAVTRRQVSREGWDNDDASVADAREKFCAGTHTMATGRDGQWLILYSIPLKTPVKPRPDFFVPEVA